MKTTTIKHYYHKEKTQVCMLLNWQNYIKGSKSAIIKWIDRLKYSDFVKVNEIIFNSFKYSGISNSLNGGEDGQFRGCKDIEKRNDIIQIENDDELYRLWMCRKQWFR